MQIKVLLGEKVMVIPDETDSRTKAGIIIPDNIRFGNNNLMSGVVAKKGTGTPQNDMSDVHVKDRVFFRKGSGVPWEEEAEDGHTAKYLILKYSELLMA